MDEDKNEILNMVEKNKKTEERLLRKIVILVCLTFLAFITGPVLTIYGLIAIPPMGGGISHDQYTKTVYAEVIRYEPGEYNLSFPVVEYKYNGMSYTTKLDFSSSGIEQEYPVGSKMKLKIDPNNPTEWRLPHSLDNVLSQYKIPITIIGVVMDILFTVGLIQVIINVLSIFRFKKSN